MTLKTKVLALCATISVVILCAAGAWLTLKSQQDQLGELQREFVNQLKHIDFAVTSFMGEVESDVAALSRNELVRTREDEDFTNFLEADEEVFVYRVGSVERSIMALFRAFRSTHPYVNSVYMGRENGSFVRSHPRARPTQYDPRTRPWYMLARDNPGRVMRTEAYQSVTTPDVNIGVVTALVDDWDRVYGVVGTDVTLTNLTEYLSSVDVGHSGQMLLIDERGTVLVSKDETLLFHNVAGLVGDEARHLLDSDEGVLVFATKNTSDYLFYYTSPILGWKIAALVPAAEIRKEIWSEVFPQLTGLLLALVLLSVLTFAGMSFAVVRPLTQLNRVVLNITHTGDLNQRVAIKTRDEIGSLGISFNQMIETLREKGNALRASEAELNRHREHLEELVQGRTEELASAITKLTALNRLSRDLAAVVDLEVLLPTIAHQVADALTADCCAVYLVGEDSGRPQAKAVHGRTAERWGVPECLPAEGVVGEALASGKPQYVPDLGQAAGPSGGHTIRAVMASPLASPASGGLGAIGVGSLRAGAFGPDQQLVLETMSHQIAVAIENVRLFAETERHAAELATLYEVGKEITSTLDLDAMLQTIADDAVDLVRADKSLILLVDASNEALTKAVGHGYSQAQLDAQSFEEFRQGISGAVLQEKTPSMSADIRADERNRGIALANALESGDRSAAVAPLIVGEEAIGTLTVLNSQHSRSFTPADLHLITMLAGQAAIAIQNAQLYEAAQQADRLKSAFLASMSHELRTPLNSIIGFTGILLQGLVGPLSEEQAKQLGMVMGSARHLLELINDVLDISKIEADQLEIASEMFDMRQSIEKALQTVKPLADKKGLPFSASIAPEVGRMLGDRRRVEQILINLLNNAIKFTETGEVRIESLVRDGCVVTRVVDTGIGIKPDDMNTLFKPFRQIDTGTSRRHEGTGLGLAICKRLVGKMGGEIWVESEWGVGSVFAMKLPLLGQVEEEPPAPNENR
jgi:signal transduction histidine kinase